MFRPPKDLDEENNLLIERYFSQFDKEQMEEDFDENDFHAFFYSNMSEELKTWYEYRTHIGDEGQLLDRDRMPLLDDKGNWIQDFKMDYHGNAVMSDGRPIFYSDGSPVPFPVMPLVIEKLFEGVKTMENNFDDIFSELMKQKNLNTVLVISHINPDGDAAGSVMGLSHYIRCIYPEYHVIPYLADTLDKGPKRMVLEDILFAPFDDPLLTEPYAVIACDTATEERLVSSKYLNESEAVLVLDHHLFNQRYGDINMVQESDACTFNIYQMLDYKKLELASQEAYPSAADYLYMGMVHDSGGFERADADFLLAASELLRMGVDHKQNMKTIHAQTKADLDRCNHLLDMTKYALEGKVAYVILDYETAISNGYGWEDIHPISGILRNCDDIELGITFYEESPNIWRCSSRSDGRWINVNELLNPLGGGGHAGAAGMKKETDKPELLLEAILKRAEEMIKQRENIG